MRPLAAPLVVLGAAGIIAALAGCSPNSAHAALPTTVPTVPTRPTGSPSAPATTATAAAAPRVDRPLTAAALVSSPCSALTTSDLSALGVVNPVSGSHLDAGGPQCTWTSATAPSVSVGWETANTGGLGDLYAQQSSMSYWEPTTVDGYPGVYATDLGDQRSAGLCTLNVAVNDHLYFVALHDNTQDDATQSCAAVARAASDVITHLKAGA